MSNYLYAARRFWYLLVIGVILGIAVAAAALYHPKLSSPTTWKHRRVVTYVASTQLLVNATGGPFLRATDHLAQTSASTPLVKKAPVSTKSTSTTTTTSTTPAGPPPQLVPDTASLVRAANLFPQFITSDAVTRLRISMFGPSHAAVSASASLAKATAGRYRPSPLPLIDVTGTARVPKNAVKIVNETVVAFKRWLRREQIDQKVPKDQRILITDLVAPTSATATGGPSYGLPIIAAVGVLLAFYALAVVLDRLRPRPGREWPSARPAVAASSAGPVSEYELRRTLDDVRDALHRLSQTNGQPAPEHARLDVVREASDVDA